MKNKFLMILLIFILLITNSLISLAQDNYNFANLKKLNYKIIAIYPHDQTAFTQGFEFKNGHLYEGTGLYGDSSLRKINLNNYQLLREIKLNYTYFGEGITLFKNKIYQLSWKQQTVFIYNKDFKLIDIKNYQGEGWGLTNDGQQIIMSNGSNYLFFRNPTDFKIKRKIKVHYQKQSFDNLNELEYSNGFIFANIWQQNFIIKINPQNGEVVAYLDCSQLVKKAAQQSKQNINVLNGIAYDQKNDEFLITGKLWPQIFRLKITE
jgi:glutamine cyclotransferase